MRRRNGIFAFAAIGLLAVAPPAVAADDSGFAQFIQQVRTEALARGVRPATLDSAFAGVKPLRRVVERDRSQAEFKLTLEAYRARMVTPRTVARGREMAVEYRKLLDKVARRFGVQPRFILAIWGIETHYGRTSASVPLIPALATLAYDARRSKYFRGQLFSALEILDRGYIGLDRLYGSWAGAMGQPQFMPSSYLEFAVDFDGDGKRDIWNDPADVLASIANYLAQHGWRDDTTWGRPVRLPDHMADEILNDTRAAAPGCRATTTDPRRLSDWQALGVRRKDGGALPTRNLEAALALPEGKTGPAFLVYGNYAAIMAYNCAHLYALTVGALADRIGGGQNG